MIISVSEIKELIDLKEWTDARIERKLKAIEQAIRSHTHNNFQDTDYRRTADIVGGSLYCEALTPFEVGDTVMITESKLNKGLFVVAEIIGDGVFTVEESLKDENDVLVTKVHYPADVVECAIDMMEYELNGKEKAKQGITSETLSRHSVSYSHSDTVKGYPVSVMDALRPYMKARF